MDAVFEKGRGHAAGVAEDFIRTIEPRHAGGLDPDHAPVVADPQPKARSSARASTHPTQVLAGYFYLGRLRCGLKVDYADG